MTDYIYKLGNYDAQAFESLFSCEGYYDLYNIDSATLKTLNLTKARRQNGGIGHDTTRRTYEFIISPNFGFLGSPEPLMKDCELKLSFDRANFKTAIQEIGTVTTASTKIEIANVVAYTEYVSSPTIQSYFSKIDSGPIIYQYDECEVYTKNIPKGETTIRFDNLKGGNVPSYIFAGIIEQSALEGNLAYSSTRFKNHNVEEFNISLNGNSKIFNKY